MVSVFVAVVSFIWVRMVSLDLEWSWWWVERMMRVVVGVSMGWVGLLGFVGWK